MKAWMGLFFICILWACDTTTKATSYVELTPAEKAREALDDQNFSEAIRLYKEVVAADPSDYESHRFLSAAYAGLGGFDLLKAISGTLTSSSTNILDSLSNFLPESPSTEQIEALGSAKDTLLLLPEEYRSFEHPEISTSSSAAQQLQFYQTAYSLSYLKQFTQVTETGSLDPSRLETMTDEDVDNILNNFEAIATMSGGGVVSQGVEAFIETLDATPGGTRREKLLAYLEANPQS